MSSNSLKTYAIFLDFVIFVATQIICGILKLIYLKGFPAFIV